MPKDKIKSVFDCNIIWQSFFFGSGASAKCKKLVDSDVITLFLSAEVLEEMREVMTRPEFLAKFETVTETIVEKYLEQLAKKSIFIRFIQRNLRFPEIRMMNHTSIWRLKAKLIILLLVIRICSI